MAGPKAGRLVDVENALQNGLRVHANAEPRVRSVQLADELAGIRNELDDVQLPAVDETENIQAFFSNTSTGLRRARKVVEVVEDDLDIGLGHSKLTRIAMTGAQLSSGVALVIAAHNLLSSADRLDQAHASVNSIQEIAAKRFHGFYRAMGVFIAEAILFTTPINYRIAWKGTRVLNNKFLYTLRHSGLSGRTDALLKSLHRLMLSEVHYAIRGVLPAALRTPGEFVTYLTSLATQTLALLQEFSELDHTQILGKAEAVVNEYRTFAKDTYEVATANVSTGSVVSQVVAQFSGDTDILSVPVRRSTFSP